MRWGFTSDRRVRSASLDPSLTPGGHPSPLSQRRDRPCGPPSIGLRRLPSAYAGRVETRQDRGPSAGGYVIVLLGVAGFVLGCFLPYLGGSFLPTEGSLSLLRLVWTPVGGPFEHVGSVLSLFAGAATVGVIALLGIGRRRAWTPRALVAGAAAWTLTWIGVQMTQAVFGPKAVGYWAVLASMGMAIIGTAVVWVSARAHAREPTTGASVGDIP